MARSDSRLLIAAHLFFRSQAKDADQRRPINQMSETKINYARNSAVVICYIIRGAWLPRPHNLSQLFGKTVVHGVRNTESILHVQNTEL